jgi:hypothetical protein
VRDDQGQRHGGGVGGHVGDGGGHGSAPLVAARGARKARGRHRG